MAILGARLLEEPRKAVESEGTHKTRRSGEAATLADVSRNIGQGIEKVLGTVGLWLTGSEIKEDEVQYELSKDYDSARMDPQTMNALFMLLQGGRISYDTFWWNLQQGEMVPPGRTLEEEIERIMAQPPVATGEVDDLDDDGGEEEDDKKKEEEDDADGDDDADDAE